MTHDTIFYQLFEQESSTYTYLLGDRKSGEAALIDPVKETAERDLQLIRELGLKLKYVLETHVHADHITASGLLRAATGAQIAVSATAEVKTADLLLSDKDQLRLGDKIIGTLSTPGHTDSCVSYTFEDMVFTGDALLIRGTGRTDFQGGCPDRLYESVSTKLFALPDETKVYPAHDYKGQTSSTIGLEKQFNPRLGQAGTKEDFLKTMSELKLAAPKKIKEALPANKLCGHSSETA